MQDKIYKNLFMWAVSLSITTIFEFYLANEIKWEQPWHKSIVIILLAACCFRLARYIYDNMISSLIKRKN